MTRDLLPFVTCIGYQFTNQALLEQALRHRSAGTPHNERLEFLGDAVLSVLIAETLYHHHPRSPEGELSRMRSILVSGVHLAEVAQELELGSYIQLGTGEMKAGGHLRQSILADALEALLGAVYLDGGMEACRQCLFRWYGKRMDDLSEMKPAKDAKSRLQEWTQAHHFPLPHYKSTVSGKSHEQTFAATCEIRGLPHVTKGSGASRRQAEQLAARHYLELLK